MVAEGDQQDEDDIAELCESMYESSAKCNVNLEDAQSSSYVVSHMRYVCVGRERERAISC